MSSLALVPAWFWVTLGTILALAGLVAGVVWSKHTRYRPEHRAVPAVVAEAARTLAESEEHRVRYGSMILAEERALTAYELGIPPGPDLAWREMVALGDELENEPTAAEVAASRAAHGYIPELDPERMLEGGLAGTCDWGDCDEPANGWRDGTTEEENPWPALAVLAGGLMLADALISLPTRLADTGDVMDAHLAADVAAELRRQDADVAAWLAELDGQRRAWLRELAAAL